MVDKIYYEDCIEEVREYINKTDYAISGLERKSENYSGKRYAWTCWWQGEEDTPDLVKACINSQKNICRVKWSILLSQKKTVRIMFIFRSIF